MVINFKKKNGITLIALVITVVILIILASVAMSLITGQNGLFARANYAGGEFDRASQGEKDKYDSLDATLALYAPEVGENGGQSGVRKDAITETPTTFSVQANATNVTLSVVPASVGADGTTYQYTISTDGTTNWVNPRISTDTSHTFTGLTPETEYTVNVKIGDTAQTAQSVTTASQVTMKDVTTVVDAIKYSATAISASDTTYSGIYKELTDANDDTVKVPVGFTVRYDSATTVDGGIVVADQNDNQWVWIPVNESNEYERRDYVTFELWEEYSENWTDAEYDVYTVGGYYIARYESGSVEDTLAMTMRSDESVAKTVAIKRDQVPYNYVAIDYEKAGSGKGNCISLAEGIATANGYKIGITTQLCSSHAWDTALNFIGNESWSKGTGTEYKNIRQNYLDSNGFKYKKISNGVLIEDDKITNGSWRDAVVFLTGQGDATKNIYDMGGNCLEYSTESYLYSPCVYRGTNCSSNFSTFPAGNRYPDVGGAYESYTFRATLYL